MRHWRRKLRGGLIEFYFDNGAGETARGSGPPEMVNFTQRAFEQTTDCKLPEPEWKPPRSGAVSA